MKWSMVRCLDMCIINLEKVFAWKLLLVGYVKQNLKNFVVVPIAFVNEHIETLHELDIEYCKELAEKVK